jgi:hypothetical protein
MNTSLAPAFAFLSGFDNPAAFPSLADLELRLYECKYVSQHDSSLRHSEDASLFF